MGPFENKGLSESHILGGPEQEVQGPVGASYSPMEALGAAFVGQNGQGVDNLGIAAGGVSGTEKPGPSSLSASALWAQATVFSGGSAPSNKAVFTYISQKGDTLTSIAANFGISLNTLIQANPKVSSGSLVEGQKLLILPVSGVLHKVAAGETIERIASKYGAEIKKIQEYNNGVSNDTLKAGASIVVPGAKVAEIGASEIVAVAASAKVKLASAASSQSYYIQPTTGFNWGVLHGHNGVDIANKCGTTIIAAAEGLVVPNGSCQADDGWNGGYGMCLTLKHPDGTTTLYAHMQKTLVELGDYVQQGQQLGEMGSTGKSTGCHLHFEVHGATNPFAKS